MTRTLQIVRVDHNLVQKANLQIGNNIIGRGAATGCNDEQVVKHAVTINLSPDDEMTIMPMVPCYMKSSGCTRWQSLKLGSTAPIKPGDVCSLLPDKCWFKIISVPETMEKNNEALKRKAEEDSKDETNGKKVCLSSADAEAVVSAAETLNNFLNGDNSSAERLSPTINGNDEHSDVSVPVLREIYSASCPEASDVFATCSRMSPDPPQDAAETAVECESSAKQKRRRVDFANEVAANTESEERTTWDCDARLSDQVEAASPMRKESPSPPAAVLQDQASASNPENLGASKREKCIYGRQCYRRNPNHKNNYSHPGDADYDEADDREECPYGLKCYRKNLQHKAQFKHTKAAPRRAATSVQPPAVDTETDASSAESVDESDYEPSVYTESSNTWSDSDDSRSEWEDGTTG